MFQKNTDEPKAKQTKETDVVYNNLFDDPKEVKKILEQDTDEETKKVKKELDEIMQNNMTHYDDAMAKTLKEIMEGTSDGK